jgi:hypothetical protein
MELGLDIGQLKWHNELYENPIGGSFQFIIEP